MNRRFWAYSLLILALASCRSTEQKMEVARDYYNIGNAYSDLGEYEKAAVYYRRALDLDPAVNQAAFNLARAGLETGEYDEALRMLLALEAQDPENLLVKEMMGYALYKTGETADAAVYYRDALKIDPAHERSLYNLAVLEKEGQRWSEARGYLERLLDLEDKKEYRLLLAELAAAEEDPEGALLYYEDLLADYEGDSKIYTAMKDLYIETGSYGRAVEMIALLTEGGAENGEQATLFFEKASLEIEHLEDIVNGQKDLKAALEAGFNDREALDVLVETVPDAYRMEIKEIIRDNLVPEEEAVAEDEADEKDSSQEEPGKS